MTDMPRSAPEALDTPDGLAPGEGAPRRRRRAPRSRPSEEEVARLVAEFHARGGRTTLCAPAYLAPVHNGAGQAAARWVR
jgi:hypothetical protein